MPRPYPRDTDFLKTARDRYKRAMDADKDQASREEADLRFEDGDQWPADVKLARMGQQPISGMPAVPARPTLVINKVKEPIRQILNQERAADLGVEIVPADDFGELGLMPDDTEIALREGLVRRIQRESKAADARTWAFKRAVIAGRGFYLVMTRYMPGKTSDQEIYIHRIYNQSGVLLDPSHEAPDGCDADWEFVGTWVPWDRYKSEHPTVEGEKNAYGDYGDAEFVSLTEAYPDWYRSDGDTRAVRVTDYWYVERTARTLVTLSNGQDVWEEDLPTRPSKGRAKDGKFESRDVPTAPDGLEIVESREVIERVIQFCKIGGGLQILEETEWNGPDMPIIKVLGDEVLPYDGQRRCEGMIRPARDAQMGENYMISKMVEQVGLTPLSPLVVDPVAIRGYEEWYKQANTRTLPYLPYNTFDDDGRQMQEPRRPAVDPNLFPMAQAINLFDQFIRSTTAVPDPTLGNVDPALKSARAIQEVTLNAAQSTSNFLDNLARSMRYEGQVINNLLYPIYGAKPGRLVRILTGDGEAQTLMVGDPQMLQSQFAQQKRATGMAKLTKDAHFNVIVKVTKAFESRRTQEATMIGQLISAQPELMGWFGDLFLKNTDGPGHLAMADRAKVMLAPPIQAMLAQQASGEAPIPIPVQAKLQSQEQMLQQANELIQRLGEEVKGKQLDARAKFEIEQMRQQAENERAAIESDRDVKIAESKNAATIAVARINAEAKGIVSTQTAIDEQIALGHEHAFTADQAERDRQHERTVATSQMAHDAAMGDTAHDQTMQQQAAEPVA